MSDVHIDDDLVYHVTVFVGRLTVLMTAEFSRVAQREQKVSYITNDL